MIASMGPGWTAQDLRRRRNSPGCPARGRDEQDKTWYVKVLCVAKQSLKEDLPPTVIALSRF